MRDRAGELLRGLPRAPGGYGGVQYSATVTIATGGGVPPIRYLQLPVDRLEVSVGLAGHRLHLRLEFRQLVVDLADDPARTQPPITAR